MKTLNFIFFLLVINTLQVFAQPYINDSAFVNIRKNSRVKSCREVLLDSNNKYINMSLGYSEYDRDGKLVYFEAYVPSSEKYLWSTRFFYDYNNRLKERIEITYDSSSQTNTLFQYDDRKLKPYASITYRDGNKLEEEKYYYNAYGLISHYDHFDENGRLDIIRTFMYDSNNNFLYIEVNQLDRNEIGKAHLETNYLAFEPSENINIYYKAERVKIIDIYDTNSAEKKSIKSTYVLDSNNLIQKFLSLNKNGSLGFSISYVYSYFIDTGNESNMLKVSNVSDALYEYSKHSDFSIFWKDFRKAIIEGDKNAVLKMTNIPFVDFYDETHGNSMPLTSKTSDEFLINYDKIFVIGVRKIINAAVYKNWGKKLEGSDGYDGNGLGLYKLNEDSYLLGEPYTIGVSLIFEIKDGIYKLKIITQDYTNGAN